MFSSSAGLRGIALGLALTHLGWGLHFNDLIVNDFLSYLLHKSN